VKNINENLNRLLPRLRVTQKSSPPKPSVAAALSLAVALKTDAAQAKGELAETKAALAEVTRQRDAAVSKLKHMQTRIASLEDKVDWQAAALASNSRAFAPTLVRQTRRPMTQQ
jgi:hypothetical protein